LVPEQVASHMRGTLGSHSSRHSLTFNSFVKLTPELSKVKETFRFVFGFVYRCWNDHDADRHGQTRPKRPLPKMPGW
jgi:hypothetical protein